MSAVATENFTLEELCEMEEAMAWAEDEMQNQLPENELYDECMTGLMKEEMMEQIKSCYVTGVIPSETMKHLNDKMAILPSDCRFVYHTLYVKPIIEEILSTAKPDWFNARRVMPDFDTQVIRLVIGRKGCGIKQFGVQEGAIFIWYDRYAKVFKVWGIEPRMRSDKQLTIHDVMYNLQESICRQTYHRHSAALSRLHRSCERHRSEIQTSPIYEIE